MMLASLCALSSDFGFPSAASGAAYLKLGDGARPLALAGAYTAGLGSVDSIYYNPAGLSALEGKELSLTHSEWLEGMNYDVVSYGQSTAYGTVAVSALRLGGGTQEGRDELRQKTGDFTTEDFAGVLSYGKTLGAYAGAGASVKVLHSRIDSDSASTFAMDFGGVARIPGRRVWLGAAALNIGPGLRFMEQSDHLPLTFALGAAYRPVEPLQFSLDAKREPYDGRTEIDAGTEYGIGPFAFRVGYAATVQGPRDTSLSIGDRFRGGLGIRLSRYRADYTLVPFGDLGLTQRFSLSILFGGEGPGPKNLQPPTP